MDVKSLYTNIPNDEGIEATKDYISKSDVNKIKPVITAFLRLILTFNDFSFNATSYLQVSGVSMGTKCSPAYANFFMGSFEDKYILPLIKDKTMMYTRYIDDIFLYGQTISKNYKDSFNI